MTYKIEVDVLQTVMDFYPGLSFYDVELIADKIKSQWDYSGIYNDIQDEIATVAKSNGISLEGKDGYEIETDNIYVLNPPNTPFFPWSLQQLSLNLSLQEWEQVEEVSTLCVLIVDQSVKFTILHGQD